MKHRKFSSLLYSLIFHSAIVLTVFILVFMAKSEKKVLKEKQHVMQLSQIHASVPIIKPPKPFPLTKVKKPVVKKRTIKKEVKKKPPKKRPLKKKKIPKKRVVRKVVIVKKAPKVEPKVVEETIPKVIEKPPEKVPEELIVTPHKPVVLSPTAQKKVEEPVTPHSTPEEIYVNTHISEIMVLLRKYLYYPRMARKRHIQGKVMVRFELLDNGDIRNITVLKANRDILAKAAVKTIERLEGKFPKPSKTLTLHVPIMYQLK